MKHFFVIITMAITCSLNCPAADTLTIIHVNDTHSNLLPGGNRHSDLKGSLGGIARATTYINNIRAQDANALLLHAGDVYIGDLFFQKYFGVAEFRLMSMLGFDAMAVGNHEFDLGPATLLAALQTAFDEGQTFPLLSANLVLPDPTVTPLRTFIQANTIVQAGNIKVGIFGVTTPETNLLSQPSPAVLDTNIIGVAVEQVAMLRDSGCTVVIMLSHLGVALDADVAKYVTGIDLIVGGHDHIITKSTNSWSGTPIVQAGAFYQSIGVVSLSVDGGGVRVLSSNVTALDSSVPEDLEVAAIVDGLASEVEETYGSVYSIAIAHAERDCEELSEDLTSEGHKDSPLGNLVTDAYRAFGKTDIAIQPGGSLAQKLYSGSIVAGDVFRAVGYGFNTANTLGYRLVRCDVLGADIYRGIEFGLSAIESNDEFLLQCSGVEYAYDASRNPGERLLSLNVQGSPLQPDAHYSVTVNEFVLAFFEIIGIEPTNVAMFDDTTEYMALRKYLEAAGEVVAPPTGRIISRRVSTVNQEQSSSGGLLRVHSDADELHLQFGDIAAGSFKAEVFGTDLVQRLSVEGTIDEQDVAVDISELNSGLYLGRVRRGLLAVPFTFVVIR